MDADSFYFYFLSFQCFPYALVYFLVFFSYTVVKKNIQCTWEEKTFFFRSELAAFRAIDSRGRLTEEGYSKEIQNKSSKNAHTEGGDLDIEDLKKIIHPCDCQKRIAIITF